MVDSEIMLKDKLEFLDILKEALIIPLKNTSFIIFTSLTSLPFLCFLFFYEIILQETFLETSKILQWSHGYYYDYWINNDWPELPFENTRKLTRILSPKLIKIFLLYLFPYYFLELFNITSVVKMASQLYIGEKPVSLREMIKKSINETRLKGPLITSIYVLFLSTTSLLGLIWVVTNYYIVARGFGSYRYFYTWGEFFVDVLICIFHAAAFTGLLVKYMEWSAGWYMSVVTSILEETYGSEAFEVSAYFSKGSKLRGLALMLVFFAWGLVLRLPCLACGCYRTTGGIVLTFVYSVLICVGNVMKWVACMVYSFHCKKRILEKKVDEEIGREVKDVNT